MSTPKKQPGSGGTNDVLTPTEILPPIDAVETKPMSGFKRIYGILHYIGEKVGKVLGVAALASATGYGAGKYAEGKYQDLTGFDPKTMYVSASDNPNATDTTSPAPTTAPPQQPQAPQTVAAPQVPPIRRNSDGTIASGNESSGGGFIDSMKQAGRDLRDASQGAVEGIKEFGNDAAEMAKELSPKALMKKAEELEAKAMYYKNLALTTGNETIFYVAFGIASILAALVYWKLLTYIIGKLYPSDKALVDNIQTLAKKLNEVIARVNSMGTSQNSSVDKEAMKKEIAELRQLVTEVSNANAELTAIFDGSQIDPEIFSQFRKLIEKTDFLNQRLDAFFNPESNKLIIHEQIEGSMTAITDGLARLREEQTAALEGMDARIKTVAEDVVTQRFKQAFSVVRRD